MDLIPPHRFRSCIPLGPRLIGLLLLSACGQPAAPPQSHEPGLTIMSDTEGHLPRYHDFGKVRFGSRVEHTYVLHNGDEEPVVVQSIQTACHCTQVDEIVARTTDGREILGDASREPEIITVPPGAELHLTLAVDTGILLMPNADKLSIVRMRTSSTVTPFVTFELKVTAQKLFQVSPPEVRIDEVPLSHGQTSVVRILRGKPSFLGDVLAVKSQGDLVQATLDKDFHFEDPVWTLTLTVPPGTTPGPFNDLVVLSTTDDEGNDDETLQRELPIPIYGHFVEDIRLYPAAFTFGQVTQGGEGTIDAYLRTLAPGARIKILGTEILGAAAKHVQVDCKPRAEDLEGRSPVWDILISLDGQLPPGPIDGRVRFLLDDAQYPMLERPIRGHVIAEGG